MDEYTTYVVVVSDAVIGPFATHRDASNYIDENNIGEWAIKPFRAPWIYLGDFLRVA